MLDAATGEQTSQALQILAGSGPMTIRSPGLYLSDQLEILISPNYELANRFSLVYAQVDAGTGAFVPGAAMAI